MLSSDIKLDFPIFREHPALVYLDNAATTQRPQSMIDAVVEFYSTYNSNIHRGFYKIAGQATEKYERSREKVANLINADPDEVVFTSGATAALNGISSSLMASGIIGENPIVHTTEFEHHSSILPWKSNPNVSIEYIPLNSNFELDYSPEKMNRPDVLIFSQISNVLGTIAHSAEMIQKAKQINPNVVVIMDASQSGAHITIDVKELGIDFLVLAGHKLYGPTGIGILYGKYSLLQKLPPFAVGGGMVTKVSASETQFSAVPNKFEAGTPNIAGVIGLAASVDYIQNVGIKEIHQHEKALSELILKQLSEIDRVRIFHPKDTENHAGVFSFDVAGIHAHDIAQILGDNEIAVRAGNHCAQILHRQALDVQATCRVSLGLYNTFEDVSKLIDNLKIGIQLLS